MASELTLSIAQRVYDYLKASRVGAQSTTSEALAEAYPDGIPIQSESDLWDIDEALTRLVNKKRRFVLDSGEYRDCVIGLPYNCPFYFIPRGAKSPAWKIRIPYFKTGEEYFRWILEIPASSIPEPYVRYFTELYQSTQNWGYEKPISKQKMFKALKRSQRTGKMITIVPDDEFLPGGSSEGQCDGWTYHLEFVSMRDYFSKDYDSRLESGEKLPPKEKWVDCLVNEPNYMDYIDEYK
ncbi:MAG: hypothetical protein IJL91_06510 [Bacteroidales bacterium]|nr:hypothetical protein [Bacteroidales bacterium]